MNKKILFIIAIIAITTLFILNILKVKTMETYLAYINIKLVPIVSLCSGTIIDIPIEIEKYINKGEIVALIDNKIYTKEYADARVSLSALQSREPLQLSQFGAKLEEIKNKEKNITKKLIHIKKNESKAKKEVELVSIEQAKINLERRKGEILFSKGQISKNKFEQLKKAEQKIETKMNRAKENLLVVNKEKIDTEFNLKLLETEIFNLINPSNSAALRKELIVIQLAKLNEAEQNLYNTQIKAPISGYLLSNNINVGSFVNVGEKIMTLASIKTNDICVIGFFPENIAKELSTNLKAEITIPDISQMTITGRIDKINNFLEDEEIIVSDFIKTKTTKNLIPIKIILDNYDLATMPRLKQDMKVNLKIFNETAEDNTN